jgi:hypothetical protein
MARADAALHQAKRSGRNRACIASAEALASQLEAQDTASIA